MPSKNTIADMALILLGQSLGSDVDTDTSEQAKKIRAIWAGSRDEALRAFPWNFATKRVRLTSEPTEQSNPKQQAINGLIWASELSLWVAVGASDGTNAYIATSPDGVTWTERSPTVDVDVALNGIAFDGTTLVAVGGADGTDSYILTSADGITWAEIAPTVQKNFALNDVVWAGALGLFVAVGAADGTNSYVLTSPAGVTWTERSPDADVTLNDVAWTGSVLVAVGEVNAATRPYVVISTDGTTWTTITSGLSLAIALNAVTWSGKRLVAVGDSTGSSPYTLTSDDGGTTWTVRTNQAKALGLNSIAFGDGFFVAVGVADTVDVTTSARDTFMVTSRDGETWGERILAKNIALNCIEYGNGFFVMGGDSDGGDAFLLTWEGPPSHHFAYRYGLPSDYLRLYEVNDGEKDYKIEEDSLLTHISPTVDIKYTLQVTDPLKFDPLFSRALAIQLAKDLCVSITGSDDRMDSLEAKWDRALASARTTDSQEDGEDVETVPEWIAARTEG